MNKRINVSVLTVLLLATSLFFVSCKVKDSKIQAEVDSAIQALPSNSGIYSTVKDGVVTLTGEAKDEASRSAVAAALTSIKGVKSVQNDITIAQPLPAPAPTVEIAADDPLTKGITDILKDHPTVKATAKDGVITVTGEASATSWKKIKMALDALRPKKVDATGLTIK